VGHIARGEDDLLGLGLLDQAVQIALREDLDAFGVLLAGELRRVSAPFDIRYLRAVNATTS
jgi:hypothetical protein